MVSWIVFQLIAPNTPFHFGLRDIAGLLLPAIFIWQGWVWLRGYPSPTPERNEITLSIFLQEGDFGSTDEREALFALKRRLEGALSAAGNDGEVEEVFGGGECVFYIPTVDPEATKAVLVRFLQSDVPKNWSTLIA
jgi:hypothetical protein